MWWASAVSIFKQGVNLLNDVAQRNAKGPSGMFHAAVDLGTCARMYKRLCMGRDPD